MVRKVAQPPASGEEKPFDLDRLDVFSNILIPKRHEAISARKNSGIEEVWAKCEDSYVGIDNANRGEYANAQWTKPYTPDGNVTTDSRADTGELKSTVFIKLTSRYVDAGASKLGEILLPVDDKAFSFEPTPVPELLKKLDDETQLNSADGQPVWKGVRGNDGKDTFDEGGEPVTEPYTVKDQAEQELQKAKDAAKKAETRIYDWMVESNWPAEVRKVIFDSARIGSGLMHAPFPRKTRSKAIRNEGGVVTIDIVEEVKPAYEAKTVWNLFPDPACGDNIHNGDYLFYRESISESKLKRLRNQKGYMKEAIEKAIANKSQTEQQKSSTQNTPEAKAMKGVYLLWTYYGSITKQDLQFCNAEQAELLSETQDDVYAIVTMVDDVVIRAVISPSKTGKFPYHLMPWQRRNGFWAGVGVGEQVETPQRMLNSATRAMLNNAGKSAGSIIVMDKGCITAADGNNTLSPDKIFYKEADATNDDVAKAFQLFEIPNRTPQLMVIIEYAFKLAEESSSIPLITQGQSGTTTPDTLGGLQLQDNNANQLLRNVGYTFDDTITEPIVTESYEWLMLDPTVPAEEKGDFKIDAHGSTALVEKAIQDQSIAMMGSMVENPAFGINPKKWFAQFSKTKRLNAKDFQYTEEEQAQIDKQMQEQGAQNPAMEVAQLRADTDLKKTSMVQDKDLKLNSLDAAEAQKDREHQLQMKQMDHDMMVMQMAEATHTTVENIKAQLAQTAMKLNTQKDLSKQVIAAPSEPKGKAPKGEAYQK